MSVENPFLPETAVHCSIEMTTSTLTVFFFCRILTLRIFRPIGDLFCMIFQKRNNDMTDTLYEVFSNFSDQSYISNYVIEARFYLLTLCLQQTSRGPTLHFSL